MVEKGEEKLGEGLAMVKELPGNLWKQLTEQWLPTMAKGIAAFAADLLADLVPGAGWIKAIYDGLQFVIKWIGVLGGLANSFKESLMDAINGNGVASISGKVQGALKQVLAGVFKGLLAFFELGWIPDDIKGGVKKVGDWIWTKMKELVHFLLSPVKKLLGAEEDFSKKEATPPIIDPDDHSVSWVEKKEEDGEYHIMTKSSPKDDLGLAGKELVAASKEVIELVRSEAAGKLSKEQVKDLRVKQAEVQKGIKAAKKGRKNKYRGGRYKEISGQNLAFRGDKLDAHHTPAKDAYKGTKIKGNNDQELNSDDGPAIQMEPKDHAETKSNGSSQSNIDYRIEQTDLIEGGKFGAAIQKDIEDVQAIATRAGDPKRYDEAIKEMLASLDQKWMKVGLKWKE